MNDETKRLQEMLERATAPGEQMPGDLDAETSSLREGWLALGKLLEDAQSAPGQPLDRWQVTLRPAPQRWRLAAVAAVAASLLIAAGLTLAYRLLDGSNAGQPSAPMLAHDKSPTTDDRSPTTDHRSPITDHRSPTTSDLAWDDSLDDEITAAAQAAAWVQQDWYARAGGVSAIERGLDEIKKDIEDGTL